MRYTLRNLRGVLLALVVVGAFGYFVLMWLGVPVGGNLTVDLMNPSTGRPITGSDARRAELIDRDQRATAQFQETHRGEDAPFTP